MLEKAEKENTILRKNTSGLINVKVSKTEFSESDGEIWYNDHLYDIVSYKVEKDSVVVTVINTHNEQSYIAIINQSYGSVESDDSLYFFGNPRPENRYKSIINDVKWLSEKVSLPVVVHVTAIDHNKQYVLLYSSLAVFNNSGPPPKLGNNS